jgi:cytidine deaminase
MSKSDRASKSFDSSNLSAHCNALTAAAAAVREHAHAPYSRFKVGAAVLDEQGRMHAGCNVENAAYPQGWCAEASALAVMVAAGGTQVLAVAVCATAADGAPVTPCGGCRQKLREFAGEHCPIWIADTTPALGARLLATHTLGSLLPHSFGPAHLGR